MHRKSLNRNFGYDNSNLSTATSRCLLLKYHYLHFVPSGTAAVAVSQARGQEFASRFLGTAGSISVTNIRRPLGLCNGFAGAGTRVGVSVLEDRGVELAADRVRRARVRQPGLAGSARVGGRGQD